MRVIKLGLISLVFFVIFLTLLSFLFPSHVRISKAIDIRTDELTLRDYITQPRYRNQWYTYPDSLAVFGTNKIRIQEIGPNPDPNAPAILERATYPDKKRTETGWRIIPSASDPGVVTVQWYMDFKLKWYPWEKFSGLLLEKRYGPVMEKGLDSLKVLLEK
jgi:hypothetical protein